MLLDPNLSWMDPSGSYESATTSTNSWTRMMIYQPPSPVFQSLSSALSLKPTFHNLSHLAHITTAEKSCIIWKDTNSLQPKRSEHDCRIWGSNTLCRCSAKLSIGSAPIIRGNTHFTNTSILLSFPIFDSQFS